MPHMNDPPSEKEEPTPVEEVKEPTPQKGKDKGKDKGKKEQPTPILKKQNSPKQDLKSNINSVSQASLGSGMFNKDHSIS